MQTSVWQRLCQVVLLSAIFPIVGCGSDTQFGGGAGRRNLTSEEQADLQATVVKEFVAGSIQEQNISMDTEFGLIDQAITLQQKPETVEVKNQIARTLINQKYTQGHDGSNNTDKFSVSELGFLDILIVLDNSNTMQSMQDLLAVSLPELLKHIQNTNWQIAVVTTDSSCLRKSLSGKRTITRKDFETNRIQAEKDYSEMVRVGTNGSSLERGILFATEGMIGNCGNKNDDWKREDSNRAVLIVSDEKNCGSASNEGCSGQPYEKATYFTSRAPANTRVYGLFFLEKDYNPICPSSGGYDDQYPAEYVKLVTDTGGIYGEICQKDYTQILNAISANVGDRILQKFELAYQPDKILEVKVDNQVWTPDNYRIDGKYLVLTKRVPNTAAQIEITYSHSAVQRMQEYPLPALPDVKTMQVLMDQQSVGPDAYTIDTVNKKIRFKTMPKDKARIEVKYRVNDPLTMKFPITGNYVAKSLKVYVDGQLADNFDISGTERVVAFKEAPKDGVEVKIVYEQVGDKKLNYEIAGIDVNRLEEFLVQDNHTKEILKVVRNGSTLTFDEVDVSANRLVVARYNLRFDAERLDFTVPIPQQPLPDTLEVLGDGDAKVCADQLKQEGGTVRFRCATDNVFNIQIRYRYIDGYMTTFEMPGMFSERKNWQVFVNDVPYEGYSREGMRVTIPEADLPVGSRVKIIVSPKTADELANQS